MDNLLGLASCMISPKALLAALRTWQRSAFSFKHGDKKDLVHWKTINNVHQSLQFPTTSSCDIGDGPIFSSWVLDGSRRSRGSLPVASWGRLFWWPGEGESLVSLIGGSTANRTCSIAMFNYQRLHQWWSIRLPEFWINYWYMITSFEISTIIY